jgi:hypothetical protein
VAAAARHRSATQRPVSRAHACPSDERSAAATRLAATAPTARLAPLATVPKTAPTTSTADSPSVRKRCNHPLRPRSYLRQPPLPRHQLPFRCPEPVSEINVAQPPLSQGSATVSGMGHLLGYARVSTTDQQSQLQVDALTAAGCYRVLPRPPAEPATTDPPSPRSWTSCGPATPWSSRNWTASAARCGT